MSAKHDLTVTQSIQFYSGHTVYTYKLIKYKK